MVLRFSPVGAYVRKHASVIAASVFLLTTASAQAGFDWVPPPKEAQPQQKNLPAASSAGDVLLPDAGSPPVAAAPLPVDRDFLPMMDEPAPPVPAAHTAPDRILQEQLRQEQVIKVRQFDTPASMVAQREASENTQARPVSADVGMAPPQAAPAPVQPMKRQVILSDDAPQAARAQIQNDPAVSAAAPPPPMAEIAPTPEGMAAPAQRMEMPAPAAQVEKEAAPSAPELAHIEGFGTDIPLALALREVVPPEYAYAFGDGVNPGYRISWNGGKNWLEVVREMVAPLSLRADIRGNVVVISSMHAPSAAPVAGEKRSDAEGVQNNSEKTTLYSVRRQAITNPGEDSAVQPPETLGAIENMLSAEEMAEAVPVPAAPSREDAEFAPVSVNALAENPSRNEIWEARVGDSLRRTLDGWSKKANFELVWESSHDYTVNTDILVSGDVRRALKTVMISGDEAQPQLTFIDSPNGEQAGKLIVRDELPRG
ncbi:MAG: TcpQ domain-containing protein [Alphaproteobacteria bacterium]|nr:TcpQ domain-containing protein [Alphaproteobacteria bacterium]